jgi:tetratricopeptide (TPR) repeat protein
VKYLLLSLSLLLCFQTAQALEEKQFHAYIEHIRNNQLDTVESYLEQNKATAKTYLDYTVIFLNYHFSKGLTVRTIVAQGEAQPGDLELTKQDDPSIEGFIRDEVSLDKTSILKAIRTAQNNLKLFPNQLDINFGITTIAQNIGEYSVMPEQLIQMLKTSKEIDNKWQWGKVGSMEGDPEEFMIQGLLQRTAVLFRLESEEGDRLLINVSEALIQYYPNKVYGYANLGSLYGATKRYDEARKYYEKALEVDPNDLIVKSNLENIYLKNRR